MGYIRELIPKTSVRLKIFDPTIFPIARELLPFLAATILVISSGKEVPKATANNEIKALDIPKLMAIFTAESTKRLPPAGSKIHPNKNSKQVIIKACFDTGLSWSTSFLFPLKNINKDKINKPINKQP